MTDCWIAAWANPQAGCAGDRRARARAVSRSVLRSERAPFSREAADRTPDRFELHLGEGSGAGSRVSGAGQETRSAPERRERRPLPGMRLHIDGSHHRWFQDERGYDLIVIVDDATSEIYNAQLVEEESSLAVLAGLKEVIPRPRSL